MTRCANYLSLLTAALVLVGCATGDKKPDAGDQPETSAPAEPDKGDPQARFEDALTQLQRNNLPGASKALLELEADFPEFSGPPTNLGLIYLRQDQFEQAVGAFSRALDRNPDNAVAHNGIGIAYRSMGQHARAQDAYEQALRLNPNYAQAQFNLAILLDRYLQRPAQALPAYERYMTLTEDEELRVQAWIAELREQLQPPAAEPDDAADSATNNAKVEQRP